MSRIRNLGKTLGIIALAALSLIGLLSLTRGTPLRRVAYGASTTALRVTDPAFRDLIALMSGVQLEPNNRVEALHNGDGTYPRLWADLRAAKKTITVQMYYSKPGKVADTLAAVLTERARAGVRVLLLLDAFGSQGLKKSWADDLRQAGVDVRTLRNLRWYGLHNATDRSHVRVVTVDGRIGYTGGFGIADYWLGDGRSKDQWREANVRFEGPAVRGLQAAFAAGWVEATGQLIVDSTFFPPPASLAAGGSVAGVLYTGTTTGSTPAERFLALTIAGATRTLYISNSYFVPDDDFRALLVAAAKRGVDVRILTVSKDTDIRTTWYAGRARYEELLKGGVRIWEYQPTMMHAKTFVADGTWSTIGSMNFDNRSLAFNNESNLVVWDQPLGAQLDSVYMDDLTRSREIVLSEFRKRPLTARMVELGASVLQRIL
jgi:cardiolipin synthase A/B